MQKKLIALAIAGLSSAAFAQSNVTIYGWMHVSVDANKYGTSTAGTTSESNTRITSNSSRIGFKGNEALGGGLSAIWQIESAVSPDTAGAAGWNGRNTFVGLSNKSWGTALLGKHDTPYKLATGKLDIFSETAGDYNGIIGQVNGANLFDSRLGNVAAYISPTFSGFHVAAAVVAANETATPAAANGKAFSLMGMYDQGPFFASLAYEKAEDTAAAVSTGTGLPNTGAGADAAATKLGLGYSAGAFKVGLVWENIDTSGLGGALDRSAWILPISYAMGATSINFSYGRAGDTNVAGVDDGAKMTAIGVMHDLSKRTRAYAVWAKMNNDTGGTYALGMAGKDTTIVPVGAGADPSSLSIGLRHSF